nr:MAG: hypothetical protein 2 [Jiangsu sediment cysto-like virus 1]QYF49685.1 MAG: hypothetical protein 3 [Jiangsu sediment cysto-like virus3]
MSHLIVTEKNKVFLDIEALQKIARDATATKERLDALGELPDTIFPIGDVVYTFSPKNVATTCALLMTVVEDCLADKRPLTMEEFIRVDNEGSKVFTFDAENDKNAKIFRTVPVRAFFSGGDWPVKNIVPGVVMIVGRTYSGKTHYLTHKKEVDKIIRFAEPLEDVDYKDLCTTVGSLSRALVYSMILSICGLNVGIDSVRKLMFNLGGGAAKGGYSARIFDFITDINNLFANVGACVLVALNPLLEDDDIMTSFIDRVSAACVGAVHVENGNEKYWTYRLMHERVSSDNSSQGGRPDEDYGSSDETNPQVGRLDHSGTAKQSIPAFLDNEEDDDITRHFGMINLSL